jgi:hypothetical protein
LAKAPMMDLYELHIDANNVLRKINNTIRRLKEVTDLRPEPGARRPGDQEGQRRRVRPGRQPGQDQDLVTAGAALQGCSCAAAGMYKDLFSYTGGNLEVMGGRSPQAKTATQEKILNANAGAGIDSMHGEVEKLMARPGKTCSGTPTTTPNWSCSRSTSCRAPAASTGCCTRPRR